MMVKIKNSVAIEKMRYAGVLLAEIFESLEQHVQPGKTTASIDAWIQQQIEMKSLVSTMLGYHGYQHVSCISLNDVVVHGVPSNHVVIQDGDYVKIDVAVSWQGYCADMARGYLVGNTISHEITKLRAVAQNALDKGIEQARDGNRLYDISAAIQTYVESQGYGIVRDFAGHGIGARMHEAPDVPNFGTAGTGMRLKAGMTFAIEPMITVGSHEIYIDRDGWTARTKDGLWAAHVEDTILITENEPEILTRSSK